MTVSEIAGFLGAPVEGEAGLEITGVHSLEDAGPADLSFVEGRRAEKRARETRAGCLLATPEFENDTGRTIIRVPAPRAAFARVIPLFHPPRRPASGVD